MDSKKIIDFFCDILSTDDIRANTELSEFEPIDIAKLVIASEEEYNIIIHDEYVHLFKTINDFTKYIINSLPESEFNPDQLIYE